MPTLGRRRALGQHFLRDKAISQLIADTALDHARGNRCSALLEIGPGSGAITEPILGLLEQDPHPSRFIICERDQKIAEKWKARLAGQSGRTVHSSDFLDLPESEWLTDEPLAVVSNLPYSAGTAILTLLARHHRKI